MQAVKGIITKPSRYSVDETVSRVTRVLQERGIVLFTLIDHSGQAELVGLSMPPAKLLVFGNPKAGTPLMLAAPTSALDLPLKILVAQGPDGNTQLSYNDPLFLSHRHGLAEQFLPVLAAVEAIAAAAIG